MVKDFIAQSDTIQFELKKPGLRKRVCVRDFAFKEREPADFSVTDLRALLTEAGFEVLPARKQPDGIMEVTLTYWVK